MSEPTLPADHCNGHESPPLGPGQVCGYLGVRFPATRRAPVSRCPRPREAVGPLAGGALIVDRYSLIREYSVLLSRLRL